MSASGDSYQALTRNDEALAYYRQSIEANPVNTSARSKMGDLFLERGDEKRAVEQYLGSVDLDPKNIQSHYQLADHYEGIRDWNSARKEYLIVLAIDDEQAKAHKGAAKIYERDEDFGLALYHWDKYLELVPNDAEAKQHKEEIRKPMLTKKQAEEMEAYNLKTKGVQVTPAPAPGKPIVPPVGEDQGTSVSPSSNGKTTAKKAGVLPTPTSVSHLMPIEEVQPQSASGSGEMGVIPK